MMRPMMRLGMSRIRQCLPCVRSSPSQLISSNFLRSRTWSSVATIEHQRSDAFTDNINIPEALDSKPVLPLFADERELDDSYEIDGDYEHINSATTIVPLPVNPETGFGIKYNDDGSTYTGTFQHGKVHGMGSIEFRDGSVFSGLFKEGRIARGTGKYCYKNGEMYEGSIMNNKKHGKGILHAADGTTYESTWRGNRMFGACTVRYPSGETFTGVHHPKTPVEGHGWTVTPEGLMYEGEWSNGMYHGKGTLYTEDGCVLKGLWREGVMHGRGWFLDEHGNMQSGVWTNGVLKADKRTRLTKSSTGNSDSLAIDEMDADSSMASTLSMSQEESSASNVQNIKYPDGTTYVGEMENNQRHGQGTLTFRSGSVYKGTFVEGEMHGYGEFTTGLHAGPTRRNKVTGEIKPGRYKRGEVYKGQFVKGKRHGEGQLISAAGDVFTGVFKHNSIESGSGTVTYPLGRSFSGTYSAGMRHGQGKLTESNGSSLEIRFVNNKPHGEGIYTSPTGKTVYELWDMGRLVKQTTNGSAFETGSDSSSSSSSITPEYAPSPVKEDSVHADVFNAESKEGNSENESNTGGGETNMVTTEISSTEYTSEIGNDDGANVSSDVTSLIPTNSTTATAILAQQSFEAEEITFYFKDNSIFTGECIKGVPNGKGRISYLDGSYYIGYFLHGLRHGVGKKFYKQLNYSYKGFWEMGNKHGECTLTYHATDETFAGEFQHGRVYSGEGVFYSTKNTRFEGVFAYGYFVQGKMTDPDGSVYEGELCNGLRHGQGTLRKKDGTVVYQGKWEDGAQMPE